ncbi:MAG TPA: transglutaminaseTgpA domain-containing protein, partial [Longimicrobiaceae bacterium]|nr:transglutaminaseTgpA domain-containing protein [Longimicrobiaceae bacterium]
MRLALLHRRLAAGMALSALVAFAAGEGSTPAVLLSGTALVAALFWQPGPQGSARVEMAARVGILALFAWMMYVAFVLVGDFMPAVLWMLLFLLVTESLRSLDAHNDMRLYSLSFALLIAATAYYPGVLFAAAFVAYVAVTTLAMMVGFLRRQTETLGVAEIRVGRPFLVATAALSGITLVVSVVLFVVFPRLPRAWNVQGRAGGGAAMIGFSDRVSLGQHGSRLSADPTIQFRVEFPDGRMPPPDELYWRGRSFDRFDGVAWARTQTLDVASPRGGWYRDRWTGPEREQRIYGGPPGAAVLFGLNPVLEVQARSAIRPLRDLSGDMAYFGTDEPVYTVLSGPPLPPAALLQDAPVQSYPTGWAYLRLPPLSARTQALADSLTAGAPTRLAKVEAVRRYLAAGPFHYTLDLPATPADATLDAFLFRRRAGHCEYFSTAMAVLLRAEGIPTREVTGFQGGDWSESGHYLAVTGNDAHAWVEVFFPAAGWVAFDPTPPADRGEAVGEQRRKTWAWPARFWLDGVEHRWYKWVLDYNLDKQIGLLRDAGDFFSGNRGTRVDAGGGNGSARRALPWLAGAGALVLLLWLGRRRRAARVTEEGRIYLALRRLYDRRRARPPGETPLDFA